MMTSQDIVLAPPAVDARRVAALRSELHARLIDPRCRSGSRSAPRIPTIAATISMRLRPGDVVVAVEPDQRRHHDVEQHQRQQHLPGDAHQLVVAEARAASPAARCRRRGRGSSSAAARGCRAPSTRRSRSVGAAQEERAREERDHDHGDVLAEEVEGEAEGRVLGVEPGDQLRFGLRQVERRAVRLGDGRDHEDDEGERLGEDVPVADLERPDLERLAAARP